MTDFQLACEGSDPDWPDRARVLAHGVGTEQVPRQLDLFEGERLRDEGIAATESADHNILNDGDDTTSIDRTIAYFNRTRQSWSANDLRDSLPDVRQPLIGARVRAAAMRKEMRKVGYEPSTLPSTHAHPIAVWQGVSS